MRASEAFKQGLDFVGTIACRPSLDDALISYSRFRITAPNPIESQEVFDRVLEIEMLCALADIRAYCDGEEVPITPEALWRGWVYFEEFNVDSGALKPAWDGEW